MKKSFLFCLGLSVCSIGALAQNVQERLTKAAAKLQQDPQLKHAILGISVVRSATGESVFELNAQTGLAPASCQKTITSAAALELLGPAYRYATQLGYNGAIVNGTLQGNLVLAGSGDPSFGSWRYDSTRNDRQLVRFVEMAKAKGINRVEGSLIGYNRWENETIPGGWIWDDMGNYYGAGTNSLNWHENQYDLVLRSGNTIGSAVSIVETKPRLYAVNLQSEVTAGAKGSGDNSYIYLSPYSYTGFVRGTIPLDEKAFTISGSFPDPGVQLLYTLDARLDSAGMKPLGFSVSNKEIPAFETIGTLYSPTLDSMNYWFMKKKHQFLRGDFPENDRRRKKQGSGLQKKASRW